MKIFNAQTTPVRRRSDGFPQSALSVQDILNMQEANLLGTLPSRAASLQQFLLWMSSVRFQFLPERFQPLSTAGPCCTNGSSGAESNSSAAQQSCSPGIFSAQQLC